MLTEAIIDQMHVGGAVVKVMYCNITSPFKSYLFTLVSQIYALSSTWF